jgi:hypothetical protein
MADGQSFMVTSTPSADVIDARSGSLYGFPAVQTCMGGPTVIQLGQYYEFHYDAANGNTVMQVNCSTDSGTGADTGLISVPGGGLPFASQVEGATSAAQNVTVKNLGNGVENLSGTGTGASSDQISVLPEGLTFASQVEGTTSAAQIVTIKNPGNSVVDLLIALSGDEDYVPYDTCIGSMAAGTSCTISVRFRPTNAESSNDILTITDLDDGCSQSVALTGSGRQQSSPSSNIALSSSVASLQVTAAGQAATSDVYITPQNGFQGQVNLQCKVVAGSQEASAASPVCSLSTSKVTISGGNDSSSQLSVSAQIIGATSEPGPLSSRGSMSLAALAALSLFPLGRWRKRIYADGRLGAAVWSAGLSLLLVMGMFGCGDVPNTHTAISLTSSNSYKVLVMATSGAQSASISIPLEVK